MVQKKKPIKDVLMVFLNTKRILSAETIKPRNSRMDFNAVVVNFGLGFFLGYFIGKEFFCIWQGWVNTKENTENWSWQETFSIWTRRLEVTLPLSVFKQTLFRFSGHSKVGVDKTKGVRFCQQTHFSPPSLLLILLSRK